MKTALKCLLPTVVVAALAALAGCSDDDDGSFGAAASVNNATASTSTTAYGVLGTPTARIVFVPSGAGVLPILLENSGSATISSSDRASIAAASPAAVTVSPVAFSFTVNACTIDSNDLKGICLGYGSGKVAVIDLATFATTLRVADITVKEFDTGAGTTPNSYSGGSCILCGVAADIGKHRFVVGGAGGFRVFDYGSTTASVVYNIPVGENFALLPQPAGNSFIVAPEYEPAGGNRKLRVVNLDNGKSYVWTKRTDSAADLGTGSSNFQSADVDAAAVDINTKMITLSTESSGDFLLVDFGQAVFDDTALTFAAPFAIVKPNTATSVARLTDVAISTSGSILLSHGEFAANIGVTQLPAAAGTGGTFTGVPGALGVLDLNDGNLDRSACGTSYTFSGKGDPHGLGLYAGLDSGQRGLIVDSGNSCAAIVDLAALVAAPHMASDPNRIDTTLANVKASVKFVKLN